MIVGGLPVFFHSRPVVCEHELWLLLNLLIQVVVRLLSGPKIGNRILFLKRRELLGLLVDAGCKHRIVASSLDLLHRHPLITASSKRRLRAHEPRGLKRVSGVEIPPPLVLS